MTDDAAQLGQEAREALPSTESTPIPTPKHFHLHLVSDASGRP